jgi:predicted CXXCH cytochrome family protein
MDITAGGPIGQDGCYCVSVDDGNKDKRAALYKSETKQFCFGCHETLRGNAATCI